MSKRLYVFLVVLMSLALLGIIIVQGYWIKQSVEDKEERFSNIVSDILHDVADKIEKRETRNYFDRYINLKDSVGLFEEAQLRNIFFIDRNLDSDELRLYKHGILEENYTLPSTFFDNDNGDSSIIRNYTSKRTTAIFKEDYGLDGRSYKLTPIQKIEKIGGLSTIETAQMENVFQEYAKRVPIHERVSKQEIELLLNRGLENRGIDIEYEYGVYSKGLPTKVRSHKFDPKEYRVYKAPIFNIDDTESSFSLLINFPKKKRFLIRSIMGMALLSFLLTAFIVVAYVGTIYQLKKQKQISEIKSDFINNMTHEFKTPIATINLAVEAIRNPKVREDSEKIDRYLGMIKDENKRMHAQVENVLRISKLEKNQLDIRKEKVDIHDIIQDAIAHIELIVADRGGYVNAHLDAKRSEALANEMHFTNVVVNILDNAVKYSPNVPKIDVFTENTKSSIVIKIQDRGSGMNKAVLKKIFEKFYREHTGDLHNVKGHGLGLAYVKNIIDDHQGEVYAESEKGKGSTFFIKLPLI